MSFIKYILNKKAREEYSRELAYKFNAIDEQMEKIYEKNKNDQKVIKKSA